MKKKYVPRHDTIPYKDTDIYEFEVIPYINKL